MPVLRKRCPELKKNDQNTSPVTVFNIKIILPIKQGLLEYDELSTHYPFLLLTFTATMLWYSFLFILLNIFKLKAKMTFHKIQHKNEQKANDAKYLNSN